MPLRHELGHLPKKRPGAADVFRLALEVDVLAAAVDDDAHLVFDVAEVVVMDAREFLEDVLRDVERRRGGGRRERFAQALLPPSNGKVFARVASLPVDVAVVVA
ncbi:unnamed protein product, partial [marine sediment metagenome]